MTYFYGLSFIVVHHVLFFAIIQGQIFTVRQALPDFPAFSEFHVKTPDHS